MNKRMVASGIIALVLLLLFLGTVVSAKWPSLSLQQISNNVFGTTLFTTYGFTFLVVGLVMFVSMLGGVFLAQEEDRE